MSNYNKLNAQLTNERNKQIQDVFNTVKSIKPVYESIDYKQGYEDALSLIMRGVSLLPEPKYAQEIKMLKDQLFKLRMKRQ